MGFNMRLLQLTHDKLIKAAKQAVILMTDDDRAALEQEVLRLPAYPIVKSWHVHQSEFHFANRECPYCVAEYVEVFVRRRGL